MFVLLSFIHFFGTDVLTGSFRSRFSRNKKIVTITNNEKIAGSRY